jgi:uncharacterized protein (DUF2062 family)
MSSAEPGSSVRRYRLKRVVAEIHHQLRTKGDTPGKTGWAVALGTLIGCVPIYGGHLLLCLGLSRLFRLNVVTAYLAAHINNPLTAPWLLYAEFGIGRWLLTGVWPTLSGTELRSLTVLGVGRDLILGSLAIGAIVGALLGLVAYKIRASWRVSSVVDQLRETTSRRYVDAGLLNWEFAHGKLKHDPMYIEILRSGILPRDGVILDLGCGRGILLALIATARDLQGNGVWDRSWPDPPLDVELRGVESRERVASVARGAIGESGTIETADLGSYSLPSSRAILLLDVLHYLPAPQQEDLIRRSCAALQPGGILLIREPDTPSGIRFALTRFAERLRAMLRRDWRQRFAYRSAGEWRQLLERNGLTTQESPLWKGTPFSNVLIQASKPPV